MTSYQPTFLILIGMPFFFGVFGAAEYVARSPIAGEGKDKVRLFVQHFRVAWGLSRGHHRCDRRRPEFS